MLLPLFFLLWYHGVSIAAGKVLIIVEQGYYNNSAAKITRYGTDMQTIEKRKAEIETFPSSGTLIALWTVLRDRYAAAQGTSDPITGAVLIGNLPIALFYYSGATIPCEYFFMDLWDSRSIVHPPHAPHAYSNWNEIWEYYQSSTLLNRELYKTAPNGDGGDGALDMWVSRIYASNLPHLRDDQGNSLTEYQIISRYLDRVHNRMTGPSQVPHRGFSMGPPPSWPNSDLSLYSSLEYLGLHSVIAYDYSNPSNMHLNQAAAWQAQLQAGPYGNGNYGALNGKNFSSEPDRENIFRSCFNNQYPADVAGFEWAALFEHSVPTASIFHMYDNSGYMTAGSFTSVNTQPQWIARKTGGYKNGKYYECFSQGYPAEWSCVIPAGRGGQYELYMYWNVDTLSNSPTSFLNFWGEKTFSLLVNRVLDQSTTGNGNWNRISSGTTTSYTCYALDTVVVGLSPNFSGFTRRNRCVADAVQFRLVAAENWRHDSITYNAGDIVTYSTIRYKCIKTHTASNFLKPGTAKGLQHWHIDTDPISSYTITITPSDIFNIDQRGKKGFRCNNWYNRSFCDMVFDGGASKVPFFILVACWIASYHVPDNLGNLYAMGYAGLTAIGNSYESPLDQNGQFRSYTERLGPLYRKNFGEAYLAQAQQAFTIDNSFPDANFILFGAGNLSPTPYQ